MERGLVREDVTRKEILSFRQELRRTSPQAQVESSKNGTGDRLFAREQALLADLDPCEGLEEMEEVLEHDSKGTLAHAREDADAHLIGVITVMARVALTSGLIW